VYKYLTQVFIIQGISRMIISPVELKMQPTIHFPKLAILGKYRIILKENYESMMTCFASDYNNFIYHN
jgi:hypothetical protein